MATRKPLLTNEEVINKLTSAGLVPESRYCNINKNVGNYYDSYNYKYIRNYSYKIPINIYEDVVAKKFTTPFKVNNIVRVRSKSTRRWNIRNIYGQDVGNIYDWKHLGIGSGKVYLTQENIDDIFPGVMKKVGFRLYNFKYSINNNCLTIGGKYIPNIVDAIRKYLYYENLGYTYKRDNQVYTHDFLSPTAFQEPLTISPEGLFGPKRLINGYITEVYVHFIYPKWRTKREARYHVKFDTGADGMFTSDYLDRVFDTDIDVDEKLSVCDQSQCGHLTCDHKQVHKPNSECKQPCNIYTNQKCVSFYDYNSLCETTIQRGLIDEEEEEKTNTA